MTISTTQSAVTLQGNNSTSLFSFNFIVGIASNVNVYYNNGTTTTLLSPSQYTLSLTAPVVGSIWGVGGTVLYPTSGSPIANGTSITISRIVPLTQLDSISNQGTLLLSVIETALDTLCLEIQQVSSRGGAWRGTWQTGISYGFGDIIQDGVNGLNTLNYYGCSIANTSGTFATDLTNGDWQIQFNTQAIAGYATAAAASAAAALVSQGAAASSATASAASAATATTEAGVATAQAVIATTQSGISTTQATAAGVSATTASTEAGIATTQAGISTTQATNSSNSATASAASATAAATSALQAASIFSGTSTTSNTIGAGTLTFTTQTNLGFSINEYVIVAHNGSNYIVGTVTSYNNSTGSLVINGTSTLGSGTYTSWTIGLTGQPGTGTGTVTSVATGSGLTGGPITTTGTISIPTNGVALSMLATQAAETFLANATSGAASPTAVALAASQLAGRGSSGDIAAISLGTNLSMSGTTLNVSGGTELVLLATATAASSSTLTFTSVMTSAYSAYKVVIVDLVNSATSTLNMAIAIDNATFTTVIYVAQYIYSMNSGGSTAPTNPVSAGTGGAAAITPSYTTGVINGYIDFTTGLNGGAGASIAGMGIIETTSAGTFLTQTYLRGNANGGANAIQFSPSSGNFTSGKVYLYGVKNT